MSLAVDHLTRTYLSPSGSSFAAVDDLSFRVDGGEVVGLIGPNGAGKTTTLRSLAGILRPTAGHIAIDGKDLAGAKTALKATISLIDKMASKGIIHRNAAGRYKSRLHTRITKRA